ncbi:hypothetical protein FPV67DRAFT_1489900 [Lyophyllum atratum]|nr:hypothetical protein FPV67DRAFT_1489900 [Lyophyllum atratum]
MVALEYPLSRDFSAGRWFTPLVLACAALSFGILTILNVALTGYETTTVFQSDYNATEPLWYDRWFPTFADKPGSLCEEHVFNTGDSFATDYEIFQWTIESISNSTAGKPGIIYKGTDLRDCDISSLYINGDLRTQTIDVTAVVSCRDDNFGVNARTSVSISSLPGIHSPLLGGLRAFKNGNLSNEGNSRAAIIDQVTVMASIDIGSRMETLYNATNQQSPVVVSVQADFAPCPASLGPSASCANQPPPFNITLSTILFSNLTYFEHSMLVPDSPRNIPVIRQNTFNALSNLIQAFYAAVRIDLGNPSPNNFLLNPAAINTTLYPLFPATPDVFASPSNLYLALQHPKEFEVQGTLPVQVDDLAHVQMVYLCRFQRPKAVGQAFIAVLVATLSMFSSGWAIFMFVATYFAKRNNKTGMAAQL